MSQVALSTIYLNVKCGEDVCDLDCKTAMYKFVSLWHALQSLLKYHKFIKLQYHMKGTNCKWACYVIYKRCTYQYTSKMNLSPFDSTIKSIPCYVIKKMHIPIHI